MSHHPHPASALPDNPALIAASTVYHPQYSNTPLAAAAAGAALRHASVSPVPMDQRTGSIPTKRMLKRLDSYSSAASDSEGRSTVQRNKSTGSLTDRRFRARDVGRANERRGTDMGTEAEAMGTDTGRKRGIWDNEEDSSGDYADDDSGSCDFRDVRSVRTSLQSNNSTRTFPTRVKQKKHQKTSISQDSSGDGHKRRNSDSDIPCRNTHRPLSFNSSLAHTELSTPGDSFNGGRLRKVPTKILEEDSDDSWGDDTFDFQGIDRIGRSTTSHLLPSGVHKYSPPPRSVSPGKSALKPSPGKTHDAVSTRKIRVSFSDEDSVTRLPVLPRTMVHAVLAPSPPPSDSSQESIVGLESALRYPKGQPPLGAAVTVKRLLGVDGDGGGRLRKGPLTPPEVPELKLTPPGEAEGEGLPAGFSAARVGDEDSDVSGNSIYSDAYEDLADLPGILEVAPPHSSPPHTPPQPSPPTFLVPKSKRRQPPQRQYSSSSTASSSSSSSLSSIASVSSFRRRPRAKRTGMMATMRPPTHPSRSEKSKSRFSVDSEHGVMRRFRDSDKVGGAGLGRLVTGTSGERGFWGVLVGKGKGMLTGKAKGKGAALPADTKNTKRIVKPPPRTSAEKGGGEEAEKKQVIGYLEKRKRFWRVRRLLGLEK